MTAPDPALVERVKIAIKDGVFYVDGRVHSIDLSAMAENVITALRESGRLVEWRPIVEAPRDGTRCLFFGRGQKNAGNENAREDYYRVDVFSERWPNAAHQYPEAPYVLWTRIPPATAATEGE